MWKDRHHPVTRECNGLFSSSTDTLHAGIDTAHLAGDDLRCTWSYYFVLVALEVTHDAALDIFDTVPLRCEVEATA